jgi:hypothetical protein
VAAAAAGHAAAMVGESPEVDAAVDAAGTADFSRHGSAAAVLEQPAMRAAFNQAVGASIGRFAATDEGRQAVADSTTYLDAAGADHPTRVAEYTRTLADDPRAGAAVAGAALASLLHNQAPDLTPILRNRAVPTL